MNKKSGNLHKILNLSRCCTLNVSASYAGFPLSEFVHVTRMQRPQKIGNVISYRKANVFANQSRCLNSCVRFESREQIRLVENRL